MNPLQCLLDAGFSEAFVADLMRDEPFNEANRARHNPAHGYSACRRGVMIGATTQLDRSRRSEGAPVDFVGYCLDAPDRIPTGSRGVEYNIRGEA